MARADKHQSYLRKLATETARERLRRARQAVKDARAARRGAKAHAQQACMDARRTLREWRVSEKARVKAEIARLRSELAEGIAQRRARVAECCGPDKARAREEGNQLVAGTRAELAELLEAQRLERIWKGKGKAGKAPASSTRRDARAESDHEVEVNLTPEQLIVWKRVKGKIKPGHRRSRTEAFLEWMHDHSADVARIHADEAERQVREAVKHEAEQRKALEGMPRASMAKLREYLSTGLEALGVAGVIERHSKRPPAAAAFEPLEALDELDAPSAAPAAPPGRINIGKPYAHRPTERLDHVGVGDLVTTQRGLQGPEGGISSGFPLIVTGIQGERLALQDDKGRTFKAHADWLTLTNPNLPEFADHPARASRRKPIQERAAKPAWHEYRPVTTERFHPAGLRDANDVGLPRATSPAEVRRNLLEYLDAHHGVHPYHVVNALLDLEDDHKPGGHGWRVVRERLNLADDAAVSKAYEAMSAFTDPADLKLSRDAMLKRGRKLLGKPAPLPREQRGRAAPKATRVVVPEFLGAFSDLEARATDLVSSTPTRIPDRDFPDRERAVITTFAGPKGSEVRWGIYPEFVADGITRPLAVDDSGNVWLQNGNGDTRGAMLAPLEGLTYGELARKALAAPPSYMAPAPYAGTQRAQPLQPDYDPDDYAAFARRVMRFAERSPRKPLGDGSADESRVLLRGVFDAGAPWWLSDPHAGRGRPSRPQWELWQDHLRACINLGLLHVARWDLLGRDEYAPIREANAVKLPGQGEAHLLVLDAAPVPF